MPESDGLLTFAEIAVAFAGFSSIVVLFRRDPGGKWKRVHALAFRDMITVSLLAALFSLLPFALARLDVSAPTVWGSLSAVMGVCSLAAVVAAGTPVLRSTTRTGERATAIVGFGGTSLVALMLLLNAVGLGLSRTSGPYIAALVWFLFVAGLLFVRLVVIPREEIREWGRASRLTR